MARAAAIFGADEPPADHGEALLLLGEQAELLVIVQGAKVEDRIGVARNAQGCAAGGQQQPIVVVGRSLVVGHVLLRRIEAHDPASQVEGGLSHGGLPPDAFQRFSLPESLRERRAIVRCVRLRDQSDRARGIHLADSRDGGVRRHSPAHDEILVAWHSPLLLLSCGSRGQ